MTTVTALEARLLNAFETYTGSNALEATVSDLGVSWTDAKELAKNTGLALSTVVGVIGSLVKKGLVMADEATPYKPAALCLTEAGAGVVFSLPAIDFADATVAADWDAAGDAAEALTDLLSEADYDDLAAIGDPDAGELDDAPTEEDAFVAALIKAGADEEYAKSMGNPFPGIICSTLRAYAATWKGTRAHFIKTAQLAGFNRFTAQTQWQRQKSGMHAIGIMDSLAIGAAADAQGGGDAE